MAMDWELIRKSRLMGGCVEDVELSGGRKPWKK
jgi:hypothetical protein